MKKTLLIVLFVFLYQAGFSQTFTAKANFGGTARSMSTAFSIPSLGKGYVVGGSYNTSFPNEIWEYDTLANSWTKLPNNYPGLGDDQIAFSINGYGYVGTGVALNYVWDSTFWRFNPGANTWTKLAHFPGQPRGYGAGFAINGKGYIGGGTFGYNIQSRRDFYEYDPATNQWTRIADCPAKGCGHSPAKFSLNGKGYVGTGSAPDSTGHAVETAHDDFWAYDPTTGKWDSIAPFPGGPRVAAVSFATCDRAYVGCGYYLNSVGAQVFCNDFYEYNPVKNQWTRIDDMGAAGLSYLCAFSIGKSGYVGTGSDASGYYGNWWEYHAAYTPAFSAPSEVCQGGTVTFTDTSVFSPTNHFWSFPGGHPGTSTAASVDVVYNTAGSHDVTLASWNGCDSAGYTFKNYITVDSANTLIISPSTPHVCSNQTITLSVNGSGSSYKWSPSTALNKITGDSVVVKGSELTDSLLYTVIDTSVSGCPSLGHVTVHSGGAINPGTASAARDTICQGTPGNLSLKNNSSNAIQWQSSADNNIFTDDASDTLANYKTNSLTKTTWYRAVVGSGNCSSVSDTVKLYVPPALTASFYGTQTGFLKYAFNADSSVGSIRSYHWDFGDGSTSTEKNPAHTYAKDTVYYVCLTLYDGSNCSYTFCKYSLEWEGVTAISAGGNWVVYPNPFSEQLTVGSKQTSGQIQSIEMYDVLGQLVISKIPGNSTNTSLHLDVSSLAKGMYYVMIRTADADYVQKVVKQ